MKIIQESFDKEAADRLARDKRGVNWPVVYILNNKSEAYVGETISIANRMKQHLDNPDRQRLTQAHIISDDRFNKSATLDIESKIIEYMSADQQLKLQNSNTGVRNHDYYQKTVYYEIFEDIWKELRHKDLVHHDLDTLFNSDLFKYTPYKNLTDEQYGAVHQIVQKILEAVVAGKTSTSIVNGEAGTGKTVLAMYILKLFADKRAIEFLANEDEAFVERYESIREALQQFKIGLVVPMTSLRKTINQIVRKIDGLGPTMVLGPNDVSKDNYDLLIVDEAHRLFRRTGITAYGPYDQVNRRLDLGVKGTQLDWIINQSKHQIVFYDESQSVRPSDVRETDFRALAAMRNATVFRITSQLRVQGGDDYIRYISSILNQKEPDPLHFDDYDLRLFDSISEMRDAIRQKDKEHGLSRLVAGYAWPWISKGHKYQEAVAAGRYDITIEDQGGQEQLIWNSTNANWSNSPNAINEVGSIHTIQGYDLNYVGVIIGSDIIYNTETEQIEIVKANYYDKKGKAGVTNAAELKQYIINIYKVLLTRGIRGSYIYVVDSNLRAYFRRFISD